MYYPVFILIFLTCILFGIFYFLIPQFSTVYEQLGSELPYYTILFVNFLDGDVVPIPITCSEPKSKSKPCV